MSKPDDKAKVILNKIGIDYKYGVVKSSNIPPLPFILYSIPHEHFYGTVDKTTSENADFIIVLHIAEKDFNTEAKIEAELDGIEFDKNEEFDDADEYYRITYEFTLTLKI